MAKNGAYGYKGGSVRVTKRRLQYAAATMVAPDAIRQHNDAVEAAKRAKKLAKIGQPKGGVRDEAS
jgi:hypothetical protein